MFSSVSAQLNGLQQNNVANDKPNRYFPSASTVINNFHKPTAEFHHYEPKSKLGQLNQRIEMEKMRRDEIRKKFSNNLRSSGGYLTESQRSNSSKATYSNHGSLSERNQNKYQVRHRSPESKASFLPTKPILHQQASGRYYRIIPQVPTVSVAPQVTAPVTHQNIYQQMTNSRVNQHANYPTDYHTMTSQQMPQYPVFTQSPSFRKPLPHQTPYYVRTEPSQIVQPIDYVIPRIAVQAPPRVIPPIHVPYQSTATDTSQLSVATAQSHANRQQLNQSYSAEIPSLRSPVQYSQNTLNFSQSVGKLIDKSDMTTKVLALALIVIVLCLMIYQIIR